MPVPVISSIYFYEDNMILEGPGLKLVADLRKVSKRLMQANEVERAVYQFSASGYRILWSSIGVDLSVSELVRKFGSQELIEKVFKKKDDEPGRF